MRCFLVLLLLAAVHDSWSYVQFQHTLVPFSEDSKDAIVATQRATEGYSTSQSFNKVARTRELHNCVLPGCSLMGEVLDVRQSNVTVYDSNTLKDSVRTVKNRKGQKSEERSVQFSHAPSAGVLLHEEITDRWYMMYQFEFPNPGTMYRLWVRLVNDTQISTKLNIPISLGPFGGLWKPRVAIQTPSNTLLGGESSIPDGLILESAPCLYNLKEKDCLADTHPDLFYDLMDFMRYFDRPAEALLKDGSLKKNVENGIPGFKPYRYGFPYELVLGLNDYDRVLDDIEKLYAMGRTGPNGIAVMQNGFTVYISGGHGGLFRFVDDLGGYRSGTLSAAKITIRKADGSTTAIKKGTIFDIEWIKLAEGDSSSLEPFVDAASNIKFSDLLSYKEPKGGTCPKGYVLAKVGDKVECLQVQNADLAGIMEPERVGAVKGATMDIFRFSQMATKLDTTDLYLGVVDIASGELGVTKSKQKTFVDPNPCGCVFKVSLDKNYDAFSMEAVLCGAEVELTRDSENICSTESVANPRAIAYAHQFDQILVGEDSPYHQNNFVWAIDYETHAHVRIFHASKEGKVTSLAWYQDVIGGNNYISITIRNPYDVLGWMSYFGSFELEYKKSLTFSDVAVPYDDAPANLPIGFARTTSGDTSTFEGFTAVLQTGMRVRGQKESILIGEILNAKGKPVDMYAVAPVEPRRVSSNDVAHSLGFSTLFETCDQVYAITATDSLPGMNYVVSLEQQKNRQLVADTAMNVDWSNWGGLWRSGSGVVTPWTTYMSGEIREPDALDFLGYQCITGFSSCFKSQAEQSFDDSIRFLRYHDIYIQDLKNKFDPIGKNFNPYNFGYAYEIRINKKGCISPTKYLTLGRFSHGSISIMPDGKTVYMTDYTLGRSVGGGFFRFVASKPNDLSKGTLYAAKFKSTEGSDKFKVNWIKLGKANNDELIQQAKKLRFTDMFDYIPSAKSCRLTQINIKSEIECLRVRPGMEKWAAFFETRRYAALQGATIELANTKGLTFDVFSARLYVSISSISSRDNIMLQDDIEGSSNDMKFPTLPCGCIYAFMLTTTYEAFSLEKFQCGTDLHGDILDNACSVEYPAGPSEMANIPGHGQILVAEDSCFLHTSSTPTCGHVNNALWSISVDQQTEFTRIMTVPLRTKMASPVWQPNIEGNSYLTVTVNEQYDESGQLSAPEKPSAIFGYIGPIHKSTTPGIVQEDPVCYNKVEKGEQCYAT